MSTACFKGRLTQDALRRGDHAKNSTFHMVMIPLDGPGRMTVSISSGNNMVTRVHGAGGVRFHTGQTKGVDERTTNDAQCDG